MDPQETYTDGLGHFETVALTGNDIVFAKSVRPAIRSALPESTLLTYPNPFNATLQVRFLLQREDVGSIVIYDLLGREVYASPKETMRAGINSFTWHGMDRVGRSVPSGIYFVRLQTMHGNPITAKVMLLK